MLDNETLLTLEDKDLMLLSAVDEAVRAADKIITDAADGNPEILMFLTSRVASQFSLKVQGTLYSQWMKSELLRKI